MPPRGHKKNNHKGKSKANGANNDEDAPPTSGDASPTELKAEANTLVAAGDHAKALKLLTQAISMKPADAHLYHSNRSLCALSTQDYKLAITDAEKCIELKPEWAKGHSRLGAALFFSGKVNEAAKAYAKGLGVDPTNEVRVTPQRPRPRHYLARVSLAMHSPHY